MRLGKSTLEVVPMLLMHMVSAHWPRLLRFALPQKLRRLNSSNHGHLLCFKGRPSPFFMDVTLLGWRPSSVQVLSHPNTYPSLFPTQHESSDAIFLPYKSTPSLYPPPNSAHRLTLQVRNTHAKLSGNMKNARAAIFRTVSRLRARLHSIAHQRILLPRSLQAMVAKG